MLTILLIIGIIYVLAKISSPSVWSGWHPPRYKKYEGRGLPWLGKGKRNRRTRQKYFWDD